MEEWCDTQGARKLPEGYIKDNRWAVPSDEQLRHDILSQYHDSPTAGHPGRDNTIALVSQHYWWPKISTWIEQYVKGCTICQQNKICTTKNKMPLYHIPGDLTECPFNTVAMDLITQLPLSNGHDAILTIMDQGCSQAAAFLPCSMTITGEGIAKLYLQHLFPWFGVPTKMISDRDPCFTSHFVKVLTTKLKVDHNISTAFHPQTDSLLEQKNNGWNNISRFTWWHDKMTGTNGYLLHPSYTINGQMPPQSWVPMKFFWDMHWLPLKPLPPEMNNAAVEDRQAILKEHWTVAVQALNWTAQSTPPVQYSVNKWVWLKAKHLTLPYQTVKLTPKCHGPFKIIKQISLVTYKLELPLAWMIHPVFHASLLTPYHETMEHGTNYQQLPPEMINDQEEYEVEQVISHQYYGCKKVLQYLIHWKGYSAADDTWELADQVFADTLVKTYHKKHPLERKGAPTFTTHLCTALAKSHWCLHSPLMNFGVTGPVTKQDCTGAQKTFAPMVPTVSGTVKNTSTPTHHAATQLTKTATEADTSEKSTSRKYIHKALVKFFSCLPHTPLCSPIVPTGEQRTAAQCNAPLNASRLLATMTLTLTHGWSAFMARNASSSPKIFPTSTPVNVALSRPFPVPMPATGHFPQPWKASKTVPSRWSRPLWPSSVAVRLPAKCKGDVMVQLAYMPENHGDMHVHPMMGSGGLLEGRLGEVGPRMEAGEPLEGRSSSNDEVSIVHGRSGQDLDYPACWPILAQSTQCRGRVSAWKAAQQSLDASVSMTIVQWLMVSQGDE